MTGIHTFSKGKYSGVSFFDLAKLDYEYLCWCLGLAIDTSIKESMFVAMKALDSTDDDLTF